MQRKDLEFKYLVLPIISSIILPAGPNIEVCGGEELGEDPPRLFMVYTCTIAWVVLGV